MSGADEPGDDPGTPDDRSLLRAHLDGDAEAFGTLFARHRDRLWAVALRTTGDREEAADALQDALISAFRRADTFRGDAAVTTWLHRIAANVVRTARRKERGRRFIRRLRGGELGQALAASPSALPGEELQRRQELSALYRALDLLPEKYRSLLIMFEMEALTGEQLAAVTGLKPETVRVRLHRARKLFAKALDELGGGPRSAG